VCKEENFGAELGSLLSTWPVTGANDKGPAFVHGNARTLS
jgi:hypothetical protein